MRALAVIACLWLSCRAAAIEIGPDKFRITSAEFQVQLKVLGVQSDAAAPFRSHFDSWIATHDALRDAHKDRCDWLWSNDVSSCDESASSKHSTVLQSVYRSFESDWHLRARELENAYFDQLAALTPAPEQVEQLRRMHFRKRMMRGDDQEVIGADVDLIDECRRLHGDEPVSPETAAVLAAYEAELHAWLVRMDQRLVPYNHDFRESIERLQAAVREQSPDLAQTARETGQMMWERYEPWTAIRLLNLRYAERTAATLPGPLSQQFRDRAASRLHRYAFDGTDCPHWRLEWALHHRSLTLEEMDAVRAIEVSWRSACRSTIQNIGNLYDVAVSYESRRKFVDQWIVRQMDPEAPQPDFSEHDAFDAACWEWLQQWPEFNRRLAAALGEREDAFHCVDPRVFSSQDDCQLPPDHLKWWDEQLASPWNRTFADAQAGLELAPESPTAAVLNTLFDDFESRMNIRTLELRSEGREKMEKLFAYGKIGGVRQDDPRALANDWAHVVLSWQIERHEILEQFETDATAALSDQEAVKWRAAVRKVRRDRAIEQARTNGFFRDVVDLAAALDEIELSEQDRRSVAEARLAFELELDAVLREMNSAQVEAASAQLVYLQAETPEAREAAQMLISQFAAKQGESQIKARQGCERHQAAIAQELASESAARFRTAVARCQWPRLFLVDPVELIESRLRKLAVLPEDQLASLDELVQEHKLRQQSLREGILQAIAQWNRPEAAARRARQQQEAWDAGADGSSVQFDHPAAPLLRQRFESTRESCRRLRNMIDDEQFNALPPDGQLLLTWP